MLMEGGYNSWSKAAFPVWSACDYGLCIASVRWWKFGGLVDLLLVGIAAMGCVCQRTLAIFAVLVNLLLGWPLGG